jgi:hypothetical protein
MKQHVIRRSPRLLSGVVILLLLLRCNGSSPTEPQSQPPAATGFVSGTVLVSSGACLPGAVVEVLDGARAGDRVTQNECGGAWDAFPPGYSFSVPKGIAVRIRASKQGYRSKEETFLPTNFPAGMYFMTIEPE